MSDSPSIWSRLRGLFHGNNPPPPAATAVAPPPATESIPLQARPPQPSPTLTPQPSPKPTPHGVTVATPPVDLVLGLDLGTSCSKVVIGDPGWKNKSYAVAFGNAGGDISAWLHPTRFGSEANLKMKLMNDPSSDKVRDLLACYVAEVIRRSRDWFDSNAPADYRRRKLRWSLNLGFPDKSVTESPLKSAYLEIARVAVALASAPEQPSPELASRVRCHELAIDPFIPRERVGIYPEIAAQLAGYVNSPQRQAGPLLLIDVGAGTLDVSTIILHSNHEQDVVSLHVCEVVPLGVLRLYEHRRNELERIVNGCTEYSLEHFQDGSRPVPERVQDLIRNPSPALQKAYAKVSDDFAEEVITVAWCCLARFRACQKQAHVRGVFEPWGNNLRFFLTGGGGRSMFYSTHLADGPLEDRIVPNFTMWHPERSRRRARNEGLLLERLPVPGNLENFPTTLHSDFDRLSVAYGLSLGDGEGGNLMQITAATRL